MKSIALEPIPDKTNCICHEDYKKRSLTDPTCPYCEYDDVFDKWREERTRSQVFEQAFEQLVQTVNEKGSLTLAQDLGDNTLTLILTAKDKTVHTHVGTPDTGTLQELADQLLRLLRDGRGLSWA